MSDVNVLHDLQTKLDSAGIYLPSEVEGFCKILFDPKQKSQAQLHTFLAPAVDRFRGRYREASEQGDASVRDELDVFRKDIGSFTKAYEFLAQIFDYENTDLEKHYHLLKYLAHIPRDENHHELIDLSSVRLTHYRIDSQGKRPITVGGQGITLRPITATGTGSAKDDATIRLSELIKIVNELFEGDLTEADRVAYVDHVVGKLLEKEQLAEQARSNTKEQFSLGRFARDLQDTVIEGLDNYKSMASQVLSNDKVRERFAALVLDIVYERFNQQTNRDG